MNTKRRKSDTTLYSSVKQIEEKVKNEAQKSLSLSSLNVRHTRSLPSLEQLGKKQTRSTHRMRCCGKPAKKRVVVPGSMAFDNCVDSNMLVERVRIAMPTMPTAFPPLASFDDMMDGLTAQMASVRENIDGYLKTELRPGTTDEFRDRGVGHPVVMIPGFTGSRLEIWQGMDCMKENFRETIWGGTTMLKHLMKPDCWFQHMRVNKTTGGDPVDPATGKPIRVRPVEGFSASDYMIEGYYVWGPIIQNFADMGYDSKSMVLIGYDWRLEPSMNERRDRWFTVLKHRIESIVKINGKPAVVPTHSYGSVMFFYFLQWVQQTDDQWAVRHIHAHYNIGGPMFGIPKAMAAYLSGETGEAALLSPMLSNVLSFVHRVFDKHARKQLVRTFGCLSVMLPQGGVALWPDSMLTIRDMHEEDPDSLRILHVNESVALLKEQMADYHAMQDLPDSKQLYSVLQNQLPNMGSVYCAYGVGKRTEYMFEYLKDGTEYFLDLAHHNVIGFTDGDGTVPIQSLGYACHLWSKQKWHNPSKARSIIREKRHDPRSFLESQDLRGGSTSGDHLDIMGNSELITDLLRVASGEELDNEVISNIADISTTIDDKLGDMIENGPSQSCAI